MDALLNAFRMPAAPSSTGGGIFESLLSLATGMLLGAGIALLLAPKTGAEMRKDLARRFNFDKNEEFAEKVREHGGLPGPIKHIAP
jgi:YtxH-like protein